MDTRDMSQSAFADDLTEYILVNYRWVFVILFLLPLSFVYQFWEAFRAYVVFKISSAPKMHDRKVKNVQKQIKEWLASGRKKKLCTARPGWQTMSFRQPLYKKTFTCVKVNLVDVLEVNTKNMTVRCEPLVTMGQISKTLESLGLALPVVPEIDDLTIGGLVMGTGIETSSHIHGLFQHICRSYELVLPDGSVVTCSKDENSDLYFAVPWSYGTLGFLTAVTIDVVPAKKYVRLEYVPCHDLNTLVDTFTKESVKNKPHQFIEGLVFSLSSGVVMLGDMVDMVGEDGKLNNIGSWNAVWFFKQVEAHLKNNRRAIEYIPLRQYYHRHTKSIFWELQEIIPFGNAWWFRNTLGWMMPPKVSLLKMTQTDAIKRLYERAHVIQDMLVPIKALKQSIEVFHKEFEVYPMWLCPFKIFNNSGQLKVKTAGDSEMFVDIGVYGVPRAKGFETVSSTRRIEDYVMKNDGFQMLYADTYTTEEEFRRMFDHSLYDKVRNSLPYCKDAFPDIYGKVNRKVRA